MRQTDRPRDMSGRVKHRRADVEQDEARIGGSQRLMHVPAIRLELKTSREMSGGLLNGGGGHFGDCVDHHVSPLN